MQRYNTTEGCGILRNEHRYAEPANVLLQKRLNYLENSNFFRIFAAILIVK